MLSLPALLSLLAGFLSLSQEILWVRVVGFAYRTMPPAFSFVLVCYLVGIALGAGLGKRVCAKAGDLYAAAAITFAAAGVLDVAMPVLVRTFMTSVDDDLLAAVVLITATSLAKSVLFPIVHQLGSAAAGPRVGRSVSLIYFSNIIGGTLGPLLTGFVALDHFSVDETFAACGALCIVGSGLCASRAMSRRFAAVPAGAAACAALLIATTSLQGPGILGHFADRGDGSPISHLVANRHGVIHTVATPHGDMVFGGNVYDGIAEVDTDTNRNRLDRVYLAGILHPRPRRVLFVGLATGAWVRCLQGFDDVEHIDVVEINPGYVDLIRAYPRVASLLDDPRTTIYLDDGRRWLRRHPGQRYDLIVQNTSFYWRANVDNLLSREYLRELTQHLEPGGIVAMNSTFSADVLATAAASFAHAYQYLNFVYASDHVLAVDASRLDAVRRPDGVPFGGLPAPPGSVADRIRHLQLRPVGEQLSRQRPRAGVITDDNLLTEYRDGLRFGPPLLHALLPPLAAPFFDLNLMAGGAGPDIASR